MIDICFSFFVTLLGLFLLLHTRLRHFAPDRPNTRSLHTTVTPRTGGLAIMAAVLLTWLFNGVSPEWLVLPLTLVAVSLVDDVRGLSVRWRFLLQAVVCLLFLWLHHGGLDWWLLPLVWLAMLWMVNLYNFMDGMDGLAGGMGLFGFAACAVAALLGGHADLALLCAVLASANLAFLLFNFHPARIFMGDAGAVPQGFLAAAIGLWGWQQTLWPWWFAPLVFAPFIVDASVTLFKRLLRREKVWQAHKSHYYQRLVQLGWGHARTAWAEYALMLMTAGTAVLALRWQVFWVWLLLLAWAVCFIVLMAMIDRAWAKRGA